MLLLLMCGDVAINPGPVMLGSVNARIRNKGPLLSDTIASNAFDFLCLTETHICTTDSDSFLRSVTPDGFSLIHRPHSTGIAKSLRRQFECAWQKEVNTTGVVLSVKSPGVIILPTGTRLSITGNLSPKTAMIPRNYGGSYTKSYIDPTALLCPLVNPQSHWLIVLLHFSQIKS